MAQFNLGMVYYTGEYIKQDIKKALHFFECSAKGGFRLAQLFLADFYLEGKYVKQDIKKSVYLYKEVSHLYYHAKNNLAIIFKNGLGNFKANISMAKEYLTEAIKISVNKNEYNPILYFNLAIIYLNKYEKEKSNNLFDESIFLLAKSLDFQISATLFLLALVKRFKKDDFETTKSKIIEYIQNNIKSKEILKKIEEEWKAISFVFLLKQDKRDLLYTNYRNYNLLYINEKIIDLQEIQNNIINIIQSKKHVIPIQNEKFYEGFAINI
ncbi:hypothetical protein M9Y10_025385 [Tritrichomonas musculus]|uniref:Beta-lactamase n=1 Tax=Tritrichomonas musculus TaxID=1915356 RepID=A0ABR2HAB5_9EUKA